MNPTFKKGKNPFDEKSPFQRGMIFMKGTRHRLNGVGIAISFFLPFGIFCYSMSILDFKLHYAMATLSYFLFAVPVAICVGLAALAVKAIYDKETNSEYEPNWYMFLAAFSIFALITGGCTGQSNFVNYFEPYYDLLNMGTYKSVDTSVRSGQQLLDAGRIEFSNGTQLLLGKSMGFRNKVTYCIAPIVPKLAVENPEIMPTWDFWAVGINCCSGNQPDFHCKGFANPEADGGVRVMQDGARAYYRLAVQQAEAVYKIRSEHPLFFYWTRDPVAETESYLRTGYRNFIMAICCHFVFQATAVAVATLAFSKLVHP